MPTTTSHNTMRYIKRNTFDDEQIKWQNSETTVSSCLLLDNFTVLSRKLQKVSQTNEQTTNYVTQHKSLIKHKKNTPQNKVNGSANLLRASTAAAELKLLVLR